MKNIQGVKIGNVVNISINGKLHKKNCGSPKEADELFKLVLKAKENPSDANIKAVRVFLNEKTRIAYLAGLESDVDTGEIFLAGFNTPIPNTLVDVIKEYHENGYPMDAIINFWKLLMINPDKRVRTSLFDFITTHDFVLTDKGYMVVYKSVYRKEGEVKRDRTFEEFVSNQYLHVKKDWKCSPNKYVAYKNNHTNELGITKIETAETWATDASKGQLEVMGKLGELYDAIFKSTEESATDLVPVYTDMHTKTMTIELGKPVKMDRKDCDSDPAKDCSYGLHVGATGYVERFANSGCVILACMVNPANVVAVPDYDHSKMRVTEYFPFALATYTDRKIDIIEQAYFEEDYCEYELFEIEEQITKVKSEEVPIEKAKNAEPEDRPMSELLKMLESRVHDIE
jgi:hypothetical protein